MQNIILKAAIGAPAASAGRLSSPVGNAAAERAAEAETDAPQLALDGAARTL